MQISGINTLTLIDFPKKTSCIVFTPGCNFRCGFCHNADYVLPEKIKELCSDFIHPEVFFNFLETRKGLLDGVVISGGEPTLQTELIPFIRKIRASGFLVKLDTNGTFPELIEKIIEEKLVDYFAMDIKSSPNQYQQITGVNVDLAKIQKSRDLIMQSGQNYEFRTTLIKELHTSSVLEDMADFIKGAEVFALQNFEKKHVLDQNYLQYSAFQQSELEEIAKFFLNVAKTVLIR